MRGVKEEEEESTSEELIEGGILLLGCELREKEWKNKRWWQGPVGSTEFKQWSEKEAKEAKYSGGFSTKEKVNANISLCLMI